MSSYPVKFGKYLLLERVNVGGMAEVFKGKTFGVAGFERILAVKRILPNLVEDDEFIRMFIDEARIAVQLNHANIVQIYELGKHGDHYYIAMEYVPSRDLRAILDRMRGHGQLMPIPQAAYVTTKVCEGLDYAHRRRDPSGSPMNIIHRDVSPQNILIGYEGEIKVIDFGIAKAANRASKTQAGVLKGKFGYMSPEQVRGLPTDRRSDVFAVGVLLYEMLTGERLFIGESDFSTLERVRNAEVVPPTTFNKKISPELEAIVLKTLAREVEDRYQWASDLAEDLQGFLIEDKSIYSAKRLAAYMKETYNAEISSERAKMEEYLRVNVEDLPKGITNDDGKIDRGVSAAAAARTDPVLAPAPQPAPKPRAPQVAKPAPPPPKQASAEQFEDDVVEEFGEEDKTFVIEASDAGMALRKKADAETDPPAGQAMGGAAARAVTDPRLPMGSQTPMGAPRNKPEVTHDDEPEGDVSLYGDGSDDEDDSRTQVNADNPYAPAPDVRTDESGAPPREAARSRPSTPQPSGASAATRTTMRPPQPASAVSQGGNGAKTSASQGARAAPATPMGAFDPVAAAMAEETGGAPAKPAGRPSGGRSGTLPDQPSPIAGMRAGAAPANGRDVAGQQLPVGADITGEGDPITELPPSEATEAVQKFREAADDVANGQNGYGGDDAPLHAPPATMATVPRKTLLLLVGGAALSFLVFLTAATVVAVKLIGGKGKGAEIVLSLAADQQAPASVVVSIDDAVVASALPATVKVKPGTRHRLKIEGDGVRTLERPLRPLGPGQRARITVQLDAADLKAGQTAPVAGPPIIAAADGSTWRLSLAAVSEGDNKPIAGAEVLVNGRPLGTTPFEGELPTTVDKVQVLVRADGFLGRSLDVERKGRDQVGPATVRLQPRTETAGVEPPVDDANVPVAPGKDQKDPKVVVAQAEPVKAEPVKAEPVKAEPVKAEPVKAEPKQEPKKEPEKASTKRDPPAAAAKATLQLGTQPFAEAIIGGKSFGSTPFMGPKALKLAVGDHTLELVDKASGKKYRYKVSIAGDDATNKLIIILGQAPRTEGQVKAKKVD